VEGQEGALAMDFKKLTMMSFEKFVVSLIHTNNDGVHDQQSAKVFGGRVIFGAPAKLWTILMLLLSVKAKVQGFQHWKKFKMAASGEVAVVLIVNLFGRQPLLELPI